MDCIKILIVVTLVCAYIFIIFERTSLFAHLEFSTKFIDEF
jgi:hypothetical protein